MRHNDALLAWFDRHRRDLPWRRTSDPYRIWLSEVMLQQTRVETVLPYYERFLLRFPTIEALAAAEVEEVLALWSGLGYYRRARQLHAAARQVAASGAGFPRTLAGLRELPGVGDYTAAAVGSIAFGIAEPVLDGNVVRVLSRFLALEEDPRSRGGRDRLLAAGREFLAAERPGDSNQAMMELGATLCLPKAPRCLLCPLATGCRAAAAGEQDRYPPPKRRRETVRVRLVVAVVEGPGGLLLFRRPEGSTLLAGTWELPWVEAEAGDAATIADIDPVAGLAERYGGRWSLGPRVAQVRHGITYRDITVDVHRGEVRSGGTVEEGLAAGWFDATGRSRLPLSSLVGKVLAALPPPHDR
ncbi:MAG: A/G-specific adenine glycosylase [Acidobacteriota bacterium]|jgi:A/G-specific adenine glycosylase|nr:A/G-specific adenine glycosylase [Acidobacteriota bacterium]